MTIPLDPNPQFAEYAHPENLISAQFLSAHLGSTGLKVVEADEDSMLYNIGHIPGAVRIDWRTELNNPTVRDLVTPEAFAELMRKKGISRSDTVVIYGDKSNWWAAFTFWVFQLFGHPDVRLLDGGRDAWMTEERDTSFDFPDYPPGQYDVPERDDAAMRIFAATVKSLLHDAIMIDARSEAEFLGEPNSQWPTIRNGHIPGAINIPWDGAVYPNGRFRQLAELKELYQPVLAADATTPILVYCLLGDRSAHSWFVLKYLLGIDSARNYDGSWLEWGNMMRAPIETITE